MVLASGLNVRGGTHDMCQTIMWQDQDSLICPFMCYILVTVVKKSSDFLVVCNLVVFYHRRSVNLFSFLSVNSVCACARTHVCVCVTSIPHHLKYLLLSLSNLVKAST
jgi:hypothetical protein